MIGLGFYTTENELVNILQYLFTLLDGSLDFYETLDFITKFYSVTEQM